MGLLDVFNVVQAQLTETFAAFAPPLKVPKFLVAQVSRALEGDYPRIVWVPTTEVIAMADAQGGDGISNPRPLWKRSVRVEVDVWEKDIPACEVLANHLVAAIHAQMFGAYRINGAIWDTDGLVQRGFMFTLAVTFDIPFTRELDIVVPFVPGVETQVIVPQVATG
jgi:hypothetical protein